MDRFAVYLVVVAVLCTLISVITEFTKEVGVLKKIPTSSGSDHQCHCV